MTDVSNAVPPEPRGQGRRVLVTGATGFTGGRLAATLLTQGYAVRALSRTSEGADALRSIGVDDVIVGDITDPRTLATSVDGVEQVYHLAAVFRKAGLADAGYRAINVDATRMLVEESRRAGVRRMVHCSTVGVHGDVRSERPANEDAPFAPQDVYQESKLEGEQVAIATATAVGLPLTVIRPGPIYGPGDRRLFKIIGGVARGRFVILGTGKPHFQLVHVDDLVRAFILAAETPAAVGRTYIIAGKTSPTLRELVDEIADVAGVSPPHVRLPIWPFWAAGAVCEAVCIPFGIEPPIYRRRVKFFTSNRWFDITRARTELGFEPRIPLRQGLKETLAAYRQLGWI